MRGVPAVIYWSDIAGERQVAVAPEDPYSAVRAPGRRPGPLVPEAGTVGQTDAVEQQRAAQVVASHATGPEDARELLAMLGLLGLPRRRESHEVTSPSDPPVTPGPLVDTAAAAEALHMLEATLHRFADARIVGPARVDPDGTRWWNLRDVRGLVAAYFRERSED